MINWKLCHWTIEPSCCLPAGTPSSSRRSLPSSPNPLRSGLSLDHTCLGCCLRSASVVLRNLHLSHCAFAAGRHLVCPMCLLADGQCWGHPQLNCHSSVYPSRADNVRWYSYLTIWMNKSRGLSYTIQHSFSTYTLDHAQIASIACLHLSCADFQFSISGSVFFIVHITIIVHWCEHMQQVERSSLETCMVVIKWSFTNILVLSFDELSWLDITSVAGHPG